MTSNLQHHLATNSSDRFLRWPEVKQRIGYSRSQIYLLIQQGKFPKPYKLGERASAWLESSINEWISGRLAAKSECASNHQRGAN